MPRRTFGPASVVNAVVFFYYFAGIGSIDASKLAKGSLMNNAKIVKTLIEQRPGMLKVEANRLIDDFSSAVLDILVRDGRVVIPGLGSLILQTRKARTGRNPATGEPLSIPEKKVIKFRPGKPVRQKING
ncbi:HU family DNA-binding protein [Acidithiobacillus albertensis]|jgi:DNA-binding protein HU-beta|uniref:HU family DNA-binding protein n=1 Tax=Acidithiobacillus albertensis TaxID=119978 RepID=UPI0009809D41|nr:HU family DNA-binding protein [Acidithiobacillus albertensis]